MTEAITATPGIRVVDGRQAIANPTTTSGLVMTTSTL
jgi:hypothetical protein